MKKYLFLSAMALTMACKKNDKVAPVPPPAAPAEQAPKPEMVAVTYQIQSFTDAPFSSIHYSDMHQEQPGSRGTEDKEWIISGKGTFTKTVYIERGFGAWLKAKNLTSGDFILSIKTKYEDTSATGKDFYPIPGVEGYLVHAVLVNRPK
ncbi:hypothetical protein HHL17_10810 [Chitinophaga sp. G-6-1-13]|uniref:Uncharacterized protein n=1 Tax=Chitinophaga fulva TaxID=2728842 RepID=A0A848GLJ9_9BACT|nr:hypothetical protein [Chitinophaga fulva]NML37683.1 hypothetical protein [Chitinophaga fulva]